MSSAQIDANLLSGWIVNNARNLNDPNTGNSGLTYPKGSGNTACFSWYPWIAAKFHGNTNDIRVAANSNSAATMAEFQPGKILSAGMADDPSKSSNRVYNIRISDDYNSNIDYRE